MTTAIASPEKRALKGIPWVVLGSLIEATLKAVNKIAITYFIATEISGAVALASVVFQSVRQTLTVGTATWIIQEPNGDDPDVLKTAWTVEVLRGLLLWLLMCMAAYPCSRFYEEPRLLWLLPILGLEAVITGFQSTALESYRRELHFAKPVVISVLAEVSKSLILVGLAWRSQSLWAIVAAGLIRSLVMMVLSHRWMDGINHEIYWNREVLMRLIRFCRWILSISIFLSILLHWQPSSLEYMMPDDLLSVGELSSYLLVGTSVAIRPLITPSAIPVGTVLLPLYASLRHLPPHQLRARVKPIRIVLMAIALVSALFIPLLFRVMPPFTPEVLSRIFYPHEHITAGVIIIFGLVMMRVTIQVTQLGPIFWALGNSFLDFKLNVIKAVITSICIGTGNWQFGWLGGLIAGAIAPVLYYPFMAHAYHRYSLWFPKLDLIVLICMGAITGLGLYLSPVF